MPNILVVTGSVRPNSINQKIVPFVIAEVEKQGATVTVADLKVLNLPFFDAPLSPLAPDFVPAEYAGKEWTELVADADCVVFVTPEYNHNLTALQKNAIDWIGREWAGKKIALVGYGVSGASQAHAAAREALSVNLKANVGDVQTNLFLGKDIARDGEILDSENVAVRIQASIAELLA